MKSILVTGGAGFIGSAFVRRTLAGRDDVRVAVLDALSYAGNLDNLAEVQSNPRFTFFHSDVAEGSETSRVVEASAPDAIVHFAAESHVDRSIDGPQAFLRTNVEGTFELLQAALRYWRKLPADRRDAFRFLHVSTDEVYGALGDQGKFSEDSVYAPNSPYAASKAAADHLVRAWGHTYHLPVLITNCSNNYGPCQFPEKLVPLMIHRAIHRGTLPVFGDGMHVRDWLHVEDHCDALTAVLERGVPGEKYNIGGDSERTNLEMVRRICELADQLCPHADGRSAFEGIEHVADRPGHDRRYAIDATKIRTELGWTPKWNLFDGLAQTFQWYLDHPEWVRRVHTGAYRGQRLGLQAA